MDINKYKNRYGDVYWYQPVTGGYTVEGDLAYWRFGGKEGQKGLNYEDLGFVDPSGGPFIQVGMEINGKTIKRIAAVDMPDGDKVAVFLEVD